jgi:hypothetical protein
MPSDLTFKAVCCCTVAVANGKRVDLNWTRLPHATSKPTGSRKRDFHANNKVESNRYMARNFCEIVKKKLSDEREVAFGGG